MSSLIHPDLDSMILSYQRKVDWTAPVSSALHILEKLHTEHSDAHVLFVVQRIFLESMLTDSILNKDVLAERQNFVHTVLPALVEAQRILKSQRIVVESTTGCCFY